MPQQCRVFACALGTGHLLLAGGRVHLGGGGHH